MATMVLPQTLQPPVTKNRIGGIDFLRGLVMIIMALDHTRDLVHSQAWTGNPLDLQTTTPILFITRWITHFCAPIFVFLSGLSAYFQGRRKDKSTLAVFLIKRGLWLIVIENLVINLGMSFDFLYTVFVLQVIWAIGISMVILGLIIRLPFRVLLTVGLVIVLGHNLLDYYEAGVSQFPVWYELLHHQGLLSLWGNHRLFIFYPFLPWTGLMIMGYCFGKIYDNREPGAVNRIILNTGIGLILFFIFLRFANGYGNPFPWQHQKNALYTILSFVDVQKYPPSLLYMSMTIGVGLLFLGLFGNSGSRVAKIVSVYGRVPFFYYVLHFYLIHLVGAALFISHGHTVHEGFNTVNQVGFRFIIPGEGSRLRVVYLVWICVVIFLYPFCKWYGEYKRRHTHWWLSYL